MVREGWCGVSYLMACCWVVGGAEGFSPALCFISASLFLMETVMWESSFHTNTQLERGKHTHTHTHTHVS